MSCVTMAKTEKDNTIVSSRYWDLQRGFLSGYQNLDLNLVGPF